MAKKIAVLPGDGIGPDIIAEAVKVLNKVEQIFGTSYQFQEYPVGGTAIDQTGEPLPASTLQACLESDAVLLGAVGGPKWDNLPGNKRPEAALLGLRKELGLYANLRPAVVYPSLVGASTLKEEVVSGVDLLVVRELTGGIYFGEHKRTTTESGEEKAIDVLEYTRSEIERIVRLAFELAMKRRKKVTSVDKANIIETSRLWREVVAEVQKDFPEVEVDQQYVDNCAMQLVRNPKQFDVIVTENMFGDILSDEAAMLTGSIGMLASASIGTGNNAMYEPIHGSAPDIAGKNIANPIATILSAAMMLRFSLNQIKEADAIEAAVTSVLEKGLRTGDLASPGQATLSTTEMGAAVIAELESMFA
ncbi:3-isopropylmalate dehydrogenase [Desulfuribacillus alkaliarsenatis]|uniref:3-isopropylmalate dehydrogenase n=1 Tax=Desulfuribacillus alkaliarsenatis TaxID=766136 RepID=A0A1E5FZJ0_9FIRM|nr:3-isopropylmalate dehydrogenase [Desulfuribacillus alkaliarsenatis]OEF95656.1 3-isopropylmalate dehydrogenase [Desulfuribacillus alkaliarsenatis]